MAQPKATEETPAAGPDGDSATKTEPVREYRGAGIMWSAIALVVLLVAFVVVIIQNAHNVELDFLWMTATTPLALIIAVAVAASLAVGEIVGFAWRRHRRGDLQRREELKRLRKRR
jgi:uncharacterized integral membrane protein